MATKRRAPKQNSPVMDDETKEEAIRLLMERAVLTRAMCAEWRDCSGSFFSERCLAAVGLMDGWLQTNFSDFDPVSQTGSETLNDMHVPKGYKRVFKEIKDGAGVLTAFSLWGWADTYDAASDEAGFIESLDCWR